MAKPPRDPSKIILRVTGGLFAFDQTYEPELGVSRWRVSADVGRGRNAHVGDFHFSVADLGRLADPTMDYDGELHSMASDIFDFETCELVDPLADLLVSPGGLVLLVERAELADAWRGFGLGAYLAGRAIQHLSGGVGVVVCDPDPISEDFYTEEQVETARQKLQAVWGSIGFQPFGDHVYYLDPALITLHERVAALEKELRQRFEVS